MALKVEVLGVKGGGFRLGVIMGRGCGGWGTAMAGGEVVSVDW